MMSLFSSFVIVCHELQKYPWNWHGHSFAPYHTTGCGMSIFKDIFRTLMYLSTLKGCSFTSKYHSGIHCIKQYTSGGLGRLLKRTIHVKLIQSIGVAEGWKQWCGKPDTTKLKKHSTTLLHKHTLNYLRECFFVFNFCSNKQVGMAGVGCTSFASCSSQTLCSLPLW